MERLKVGHPRTHPAVSGVWANPEYEYFVNEISFTESFYRIIDVMTHDVLKVWHPQTHQAVSEVSAKHCVIGANLTSHNLSMKSLSLNHSMLASYTWLDNPRTKLYPGYDFESGWDDATSWMKQSKFFIEEINLHMHWNDCRYWLVESMLVVLRTWLSSCWTTHPPTHSFISLKDKI